MHRRLCIASLSVLALVALAGGVAWACGPNTRMELSAFSGPPGREAVVTGSGFLPGPIELRLGSAGGPQVAAAAGPDFSVPISFPAAQGTYLLVAVHRDASGNTLSMGSITFQVTAPPTLELTPRAGLPASTVGVQGSDFGDGAVEIRWDSDGGRLLARAAGPTFSRVVTIPPATRGRHRIVAVGRDGEGRFFGRTSTAFDVTQTGYALPARDTVGPAIRGAALASANRTRTVSRGGYVTLLCGRFEESGVTGECGARSVRRLAPGGARGRSIGRSLVLALRRRSFSAQTGRPVRVRFRLGRRSMAALRRARKVRMRGLVVSRDRLRNESRTTFRFVLKAPRRARDAGAAAARAGSPAGW